MAAALIVVVAIALAEPQVSPPELQGFNFYGGWTVALPYRLWTDGGLLYAHPIR